MSDFYQPPSRASGTETALRGIATTGAATTMVGYQNASLYKIDHPCWVSLLATVGDRGWSYALEKTEPATVTAPGHVHHVDDAHARAPIAATTITLRQSTRIMGTITRLRTPTTGNHHYIYIWGRGSRIRQQRGYSFATRVLAKRASWRRSERARQEDAHRSERTLQADRNNAACRNFARPRLGAARRDRKPEVGTMSRSRRVYGSDSDASSGADRRVSVVNFEGQTGERRNRSPQGCARKSR
jgi:hypothetical protein